MLPSSQEPYVLCVCVCVCVRACVYMPKPCDPGQKLCLNGWFYPLFGMCVSSPDSFWWLLGPCLLYNPSPQFFSPLFILGVQDFQPEASALLLPCPPLMSPHLPPPPARLWPVALRHPHAGHPDLGPKSRVGGPPTFIPVCVASCALGKVENSINFWCSGLQMWSFLLGQAWGQGRYSGCA